MAHHETPLGGNSKLSVKQLCQCLVSMCDFNRVIIHVDSFQTKKHHWCYECMYSLEEATITQNKQNLQIYSNLMLQGVIQC